MERFIYHNNKGCLVILALLMCLFVDVSFAETSGVDPYETVQSFLSTPSDTTRESVVELTRSIFTKPYGIYSPEIYAPSGNSEDLSITYLEQIFGNVPGVLAGDSTLLSQMFYIFNMGVFAVVGLILSMIIITNTVNTGAQGQFMGRRNQNPYWIWFRSFTGVSILMPSYNGYSLIQVIIMWVAVQGIGLSNAIWAEVQNIVYKTNSILSYVKLVDAEANTSVAGVDPITEAKQKAYNRCEFIDDKDCTSTGGFLGNKKIDNAMNLTQMLIMYQSCLSYNLKQWEASYEACMKVAGNYDGISCYPPKRENLYQVNYSTYSIKYVGPADQSAQTFGCGNIQMTATCTDSTSCGDYQKAYDKNLFDAFITLFNAAEKPADDVFQFYDTCDNANTETSCYNPPNEETSASCIGSDTSVNANCTITDASIKAMTDMVEKSIAYQMDYVDNATVTDSNTGKAQTGYADPLGFMDGGWILAGNSYGTMVYYGAKADGSGLPLLNTFSASLSSSSLPNTLNYVYGFLMPNASISDQVGGNSQHLAPEQTLQRSLLDWSNPVSENEIQKATEEYNNANNSDSTTITGAPVNECLTGDYYYKDGKAVACNEVLGGEPPATQPPNVEGNCGKNDYSMRYLSCIATNNISNGEYKKFAFNASTQGNWSKFLEPTYDIGVSVPFGTPPDWESISTDYFNKIHTAWVLAMFGGKDVRNIVDPIYRMRMMGIKMINYSTDYVQQVVGETLDYVQQVVMDFYFGYFAVQLAIFFPINLLEIFIGSLEQFTIDTLEKIALALTILLPWTAPIIAIIMAFIFTLKEVVAAIFVIFQIINWIFDALAQLIPYVAQMIILSGTQFFSLYLAIAVPILVLGGYLAGYLSMVPYMIFLVTVAGWFLLILESIIAAPLIALGVTYPQGHDFFGRSEQLLSMMLSVFLRPACILIGFIFGIMMASMSLFLINAILFPVIVNYLGFLTGSDFLTIELTNFLQGSAGDPFASYTGGIIDTFIYFILMLLYAYTASSVLIYCFSLTFMIPYQLTRWVDPRAAESPEEVRGSMDEIKQSFVGEVIAGMANALTSLFALTSMFSQVAQMAPSGSGRINISQEKVKEMSQAKDASVSND